MKEIDNQILRNQKTIMDAINLLVMKEFAIDLSNYVLSDNKQDPDFCEIYTKIMVELEQNTKRTEKLLNQIKDCNI